MTYPMNLEVALSSIKQQKSRFYVYIIRKPEGSAFYVGKGKGRRIAHHEEYAKQPGSRGRKASTIKGLWNRGLKPEYEIVGFFDDEAEAFSKEISLISEIGRIDFGTGPLTNVSVGGEGNADRVVSEETKQKLRSRVFSMETRAKYKAVLRNPRTIAKRLEAEPRRIAKVSAALKEPQHRALKSEIMTEFLRENPDIAEARRAHLREIRSAPGYAERQAAISQKGWSDPVIRERRIVGLKRRHNVQNYS